MNSEALIDDFISKPKIGRLPPSILQEREGEKSGSDLSVGKILVLGVITLTAVLLGYQYNRISPDDARLLALINSADDVVKPSQGELHFKDSGGIIDGQMVKIVPEAVNVDQGSVASGGQEPPKPPQRELLSIVGKY